MNEEQKAIEKEIALLTRRVADKKVLLRLEKTKDYLNRYDAVRKEVDALETALKILRNEHGNYSVAVGKITEHKDKLSRSIEEKEIKAARLDNVISEKENHISVLEKKKQELEDECRSVIADRDKKIIESQARQKNIEMNISILREQEKSEIEQNRKAKVRTQETIKELSETESRLSALKELLSEEQQHLVLLNEQIGSALKQLQVIKEEGGAILIQHKENKESLERELEDVRESYIIKEKKLEEERIKRWEELSTREVEIEEKELFDKRREEILATKAKQLRDIKSKLEVYLGKPIKMII